ncbi:MAG: hypothetical protein WBQ37_10685 [Candidatus Competibacter sp.]
MEADPGEVGSDAEKTGHIDSHFARYHAHPVDALYRVAGFE